MSKFNHIQTSFTSGEVSEKFKGRPDLKEYNDSLDVLENFVIQKQGGATKRPGTRFVKSLDFFSTADTIKIIPFSFSKNESYSVILPGNPNSVGFLKMFRSTGNEITNIDLSEVLVPQLGTYDPKNWKYAQSGDVLVLTYSAPNTEAVLGLSGLLANQLTFHGQIPPVFIVRDKFEKFTVFSSTHPDFLDSLPGVGKFSPTVFRPYLSPNVDPNIRLHVNTPGIGVGRILLSTDKTGANMPLFTLGHTFATSSGAPSRIGAFFKIQKAGTEGVCWGETGSTKFSDIVVASASINVGTDAISITAHELDTRDKVLYEDSGAIGTPPTVTGLSFGDEVFIGKLSANSLALYQTQADADADTNRIDFTAAGTSGFRLQIVLRSRMDITIEVAMEGTLTSAGGASDDWQEAAWSAHQGFPRAVAFHEQRLIFGGTERRPDTLWMSQIGNIYNMMARRLEQDSSAPTSNTVTQSGLGFILSSTITVSDPLSATIASKQANIIQWLESQNVLLCGTLGSEYTISGGDFVISNESIFVKKQTDYGSNNIQAISVGNAAIFSTRDGRRLRDFKFNRDNGSYLATNLSVLAEHMVFKGFDGLAASSLKGVEFKEIAYQPSRDTLWAVTTNGQLLGVTLSKEAKILAWHYHPTRSTDTISSIAVIPNEDGSFDDLWLTTIRSIDSVDRAYLEKMGDDFEHTVLGNTSTEDNDTPYYSDSSIKITLTSTTSTVNLPLNMTSNIKSHLEGAVVKVLVDGVVDSDKTVTSALITLDASHPSGTVVIIGLPYTAKLRTLDIEAGGDFGSSQGNRQRIDRVSMRLYKSQKGKYGNRNQTTLFGFEYDDNEIFSGLVRVDFEITPNMENQIVIEHDDPVPFTILSMTYRGVSYD